MGLEVKVKQSLLDTPETRKALIPPGKETGQAVLPFMPAYKMTEDVLTRLHKIMTPDFRSEFTGKQLYETMLKGAFAKLRTTCRAYLWLCDMTDGIPWRKLAEQFDRSKKAAKAGNKPYHPLARIVDGGVVGGSGQSEAVELIDSHRLAATRALRVAMAMYFLGMVQNEKLPDDRLLVMDFKFMAPIAYMNGKFFVPWKNRHRIGEADMMCVYWMHVLRNGFNVPGKEEKWDTVVQTVDTDHFPIVANYIHTSGLLAEYLAVPKDSNPNKTGYRVFLCLGKNKKLKHDEIWDMTKLTDTLVNRMLTTPRRFALACIAGGTDFVDKSDLTHGVGTQKVLAQAYQSSAAGTGVELPLPEPMLLDAIGEQVWEVPPAPEGKTETKTLVPAGSVKGFAAFRDKMQQSAMSSFLETKTTLPKGLPGYKGLRSSFSEWKPTTEETDETAHRKLRQSEVYHWFVDLLQAVGKQEVISTSVFDAVLFNLSYWTLDWSKVPTIWDPTEVDRSGIGAITSWGSHT